MGRTTAPLRVRRFRSLWVASVFSNIGQLLQMVAASWLMLELTDSPVWVGLMVASPTLPLLFFALPSGALADLVDRRRILLLSQSLMAAGALAMALLWFAGTLPPGLLLTLGFVMGVGHAFNLPAWQAIVPDLVPRRLVAGAVALNAAGFNVARVVGPALGGVLVAVAGPGTAFALNAVSYLGVIAVIASFRGGRWFGDAEASLTSAIALGLRYVRFTPAFRWLLLVAALFAMTTAVLQALLPNLTRDTLGGDASAFGLLLGAMGLGALVGALSRHHGSSLLGRNIVPWSMLGSGVAGMVVGVSRSFALTALGLAAAGMLWVWTLTTLNATAQLLAPTWLRGRIMSLYTLAFVGFLPLGSILAGALGAAVGVPAAVLLLSAGAVALGAAGLRLPLPVLEEIVAPQRPRHHDQPAHPRVVKVKGDRVMVSTTWVIDEADLDAFLEVMDQLRLVRLRTGAFRWRLYREAEDAHRMTEVFLLTSWAQHLRQHERIDAQAAAVIERARAFDRGGGPLTSHHVAVDVTRPDRRPEWEDLLAVHAEMHRGDGSLPLGERPVDAPR